MDNQYIDQTVDILRVECEICKRKFSQDRIDIHKSICEEIKRKSGMRSVFNSFKQRKFHPLVLPTANTYRSLNLKQGIDELDGRQYIFPISSSIQQGSKVSKLTQRINERENQNAVDVRGMDFLTKPKVINMSEFEPADTETVIISGKIEGLVLDDLRIKYPSRQISGELKKQNQVQLIIPNKYDEQRKVGIEGLHFMDSGQGYAESHRTSSDLPFSHLGNYNGKIYMSESNSKIKNKGNQSMCIKSTFSKSDRFDRSSILGNKIFINECSEDNTLAFPNKGDYFNRHRIADNKEIICDNEQSYFNHYRECKADIILPCNQIPEENPVAYKDVYDFLR